MSSLWWETCNIEERQSLEGTIETEIAVIGGGITGILTAYQLQKEGRKVIVLEADRIGSGQTKNTTAKITSLHGLCYHSLIKKLGEVQAKQYAQANQEAISAYENLVMEEQISCDFERQAAFAYGRSSQNLQAETEAALRLGLPASLKRDHLTLPFPVWGAVEFYHQAQFHPLKFIKALAKKLTIYEKSPVRHVEDHILYTDQGSVSADCMVFTCHIPFLNIPGFYFARVHQERSYVLALEHAMETNGMYIGSGDHVFSFRNYGPYLLLGGEGHRTGEDAFPMKYQQLRTEAKKWFPNSREVYCWSAQDGITSDDVPYIGPYSKSKPNWYVATGFQKWGMTHSMVSAVLLRDLICGKSNDYAEVFSPQRFSESTLGFLCKEGGHSVKGLTRQLLKSPEQTAKDILPGQGGVVSFEGKKLGIYKEETGEIYAVDTRCPHLGCQLEWNPDERSWDCPCHGSRFDYKGKLLNGPAQTSLHLSCSLKKDC